MATVNGWTINHRSSVDIYISENGKSVIAREEGAIIAELTFLDSGVRINPTRSEVTVNDQNKTIVLK